MKGRLAIWKRGSLLTGAAVMLLGPADSLRAGVPIVFPEGRAHEPYLKSRPGTGVPILVPRLSDGRRLTPELPSNKPSAFSESAGGSISDYQPPADRGSVAPRRTNPQVTKQMQEEQANKQFWLFQDPEKEKLKDASDLEGKSFTARDIEKQSSSLDPTFKGLSTFDSKAPSDEQTGRYDADNGSGSVRPSESSRSAPHASPELSLSRLLAPISGASFPSADSQSASSLKNLLESAPGADRQPGQDSLGAPSLSKAPVSTFGARDPINVSPDASRQPLAPLVGAPRSASQGARPGSLNSLGGLPSSTPSPPLAPGGMNPRSSRITGFSSLPSAGFTPAQQPPPWATAGPKDPMRRRF